MVVFQNYHSLVDQRLPILLGVSAPFNAPGSFCFQDEALARKREAIRRRRGAASGSELPSSEV